VRKGRAEWVRIVSVFERTGPTQAEFCKARGLTLSTFRLWLYRLRKGQGKRQQRRPKLVELVSVPERADESACVLRVGACEVRFSGRPDVEYLSALLRAVENQ